MWVLAQGGRLKESQWCCLWILLLPSSKRAPPHTHCQSNPCNLRVRCKHHTEALYMQALRLTYLYVCCRCVHEIPPGRIWSTSHMKAPVLTHLLVGLVCKPMSTWAHTHKNESLTCSADMALTCMCFAAVTCHVQAFFFFFYMKAQCGVCLTTAFCLIPQTIFECVLACSRFYVFVHLYARWVSVQAIMMKYGLVWGNTEWKIETDKSFLITFIDFNLRCWWTEEWSKWTSNGVAIYLWWMK